MVKITAPRPLAKSDNRASFDCGYPVLNHWLQRHAWGNEQAHASRTYVITDQQNDHIAGYVTLATGQVERMWMTKTNQRNMPNPVPVIILGRLAIDKNYQGQGLGADMLGFAFTLASVASASIGAVGVVTHPLNAAAHGFYQRWGFCDLPGDPKASMFIRMKDIIASKP